MSSRAKRGICTSPSSRAQSRDLHPGWRTCGARPHHPSMTLLLWLAVALVALWLVVKFVFKVVGCAVHVLLIAAVIAAAIWLLRGGLR